MLVLRRRRKKWLANKYDYVIVNDVLEKAVEDFKAIIRAEELSTRVKWIQRRQNNVRPAVHN